MTSSILKKYGIYHDSDVRLFESQTRHRSISKDEIILKPGEICKSLFYTLSGAFYQYTFTNEAEENVIDLHIEGEWFLNQNSLVTQKPSENYIKAKTESTIFELPINSLHFLISSSPIFLQLGKIFEQSTSRIHFFDNRLTPAQKYQYLLDNRSGLIQRFPLKLIASYLKITPETLSRVRENLSKRKAIS